MIVITKYSNKPYNKSSVSKIIIIKSHWLEKKPPLIFPSVKEKLLLLLLYINISFSPHFSAIFYHNKINIFVLTINKLNNIFRQNSYFEFTCHLQKKKSVFMYKCIYINIQGKSKW